MGCIRDLRLRRNDLIQVVPASTRRRRYKATCSHPKPLHCRTAPADIAWLPFYSMQAAALKLTAKILNLHSSRVPCTVNQKHGAPEIHGVRLPE